MRDLRTPDRQIVRVNSITNDGRMTGMLYSYTPYFQVHAFRTLLDGTLEDLGDTVYASVGWHINESGQVTGYAASTVDNNTQAAFRFSDGAGKVSLGTLGGKRSSGMSINASGVVVGWSEVASTSIWSRAFRAIPGQPMQDLGTLSGTGAAGAEAINDNGTIVGWATGRYWMTAFVFTDADGMVDLNSRLLKSDPAPPLTDAMGVNNSGQVVVLYQTSTGGFGSVRLTPVIDTEAPAIVSASVTPDVLFPPTEQMVPVSVSVSAVDNLDPAPVCRIANVANSEGPTSGPDPDVQIVDAYSALLRSTRLGSGTGRIYTITVGCRDASGNTATTQLLVRVLHDQSKLD
jgi:probable HAF family extracellular repeat protein